MSIFDLFRRKTEKRTAGGYTGQVMALRENWINGQTGIADATAAVQACVGLWENAFGAADSGGVLDRATLRMAARALALRGEALFYIGDDGFWPVEAYDYATKNGKISSYRLSLVDSEGSIERVALAAEVLHFRIGVDAVSPWQGASPLARSSLTAGMLKIVEDAISEVYANAPIGSAVVPFPEATGTDMETLARGFRGKRGRVLLRESVNVAAQGGMAPQGDWRAQELTPDIERAAILDAWAGAQKAILLAYGVLPALLEAGSGPTVREAQRYLAVQTLQPIAQMMAEELTEKLGQDVEIDVMRPLQAYDIGTRARGFATLIQGLAMAKEAGIDPETALKLVNFGADDDAF